MSKTVVSRNNVITLGRADGPVVMLAHGFGCSQDLWRRVLPALVDDYRVVLFDHVGAGHSDLSAYDSSKYSTLDGYADDLLEICVDLDLRDVTLVAHSVGAMMAVVAAVHDPSRFKQLILVAPSPCYINDPRDGYVGGFTREDIDGLLQSLDSNYYVWANAIAPMVMGNDDSPELGQELTESFCETDPTVAKEFARVTFLSDIRPLLADVKTPALLLQCSDDALAPPEVGAYLARHLESSTLLQMRATGHCPHVSAPEETVAAMLGYLNAGRAVAESTARVPG